MLFYFFLKTKAILKELLNNDDCIEVWSS